MLSLCDLLIKHEGLRLKPYRCTADKLTIGCGRNLDDIGISEREAMFLLDNDIARVTREIQDSFPWVLRLPEVCGIVLCNMAFNLGLPRLRLFKQFLAALEVGNFALAADEMLRSRWAEQVGGRARELAEMIQHATHS